VHTAFSDQTGRQRAEELIARIDAKGKFTIDDNGYMVAYQPVGVLPKHHSPDQCLQRALRPTARSPLLHCLTTTSNGHAVQRNSARGAR
jgi:hypothetical protein